MLPLLTFTPSRVSKFYSRVSFPRPVFKTIGGLSIAFQDTWSSKPTVPVHLSIYICMFCDSVTARVTAEI